MAWSDIPGDLLCCIASHLSVVQFVRFPIVCSSWNNSLADKSFRKIHCYPSPWLLLPPYNSKEETNTLTFLDFTFSKEGFHRKLSSISTNSKERLFHPFLGSNKGWLVRFDEKYMKPFLINPLLKAQISLPSFHNIPQARSNPFSERITFGLIGKIVISSNEMTGTAVTIYDMFFLVLAKPRDEHWFLGLEVPPYRPRSRDEYNDIYFYKKEQRFYAITRFSAVQSFDLDGQNVHLICPAMQDSKAESCDLRNYIIFLSDTLLKIERIATFVEETIDKNSTGKTTKICVFKFMSQLAISSYCSSAQWIPIKDLGGYSLFIGYNQTFSLHHNSVPGINPNCIYFADGREDMSAKDGDRDAGFFDLEHDCFQYFLDTGSYSTWPPSIWFTPSLS